MFRQCSRVRFHRHDETDALANARYVAQIWCCFRGDRHERVSGASGEGSAGSCRRRLDRPGLRRGRAGHARRSGRRRAAPELAQQRRPFVAPWRPLARYRHLDHPLDHFDRAAARRGRARLLPGALPTRGRAPFRDPASRLDLDRATAPAAGGGRGTSVSTRPAPTRTSTAAPPAEPGALALTCDRVTFRLPSHGPPRPRVTSRRNHRFR
jgi:hypothetical protein